MALTSVKKCDCKHSQQDKMYGKGYRLHNVCKEGKAWRCTVCGNVKNIK